MEKIAELEAENAELRQRIQQSVRRTSSYDGKAFDTKAATEFFLEARKRFNLTPAQAKKKLGVADLNELSVTTVADALDLLA